MEGNRATVQRYAEAIRTGNWEAAAAMLHPDYVCEFPQTGELIRGRANFEAIYSRFPGGLPETEHLETVGGEKPMVHVAPQQFGLPIITVSGGSDTYTVTGKARYMDGEEYHIISILHLRDMQIIKEKMFWAPPAEAPEWRREFVELLYG